MVKTAHANSVYHVDKSVLKIRTALTMPNVLSIAQTAMESAKAICRKLSSANNVGSNSVCQRMSCGGGVRVRKVVANRMRCKIDL